MLFDQGQGATLWRKFFALLVGGLMSLKICNFMSTSVNVRNLSFPIEKLAQVGEDLYWVRRECGNDWSSIYHALDSKRCSQCH